MYWRRGSGRHRERASERLSLRRILSTNDRHNKHTNDATSGERTPTASSMQPPASPFSDAPTLLMKSASAMSVGVSSSWGIAALQRVEGQRGEMGDENST